jgi:hypothetical protein
MRPLVEVINERHQVCASRRPAVEFRDIHRFALVRALAKAGEPLFEGAAVAGDELRLLTPRRDVEGHQPIGEIQNKLAIRWPR